MTTFEDHFSKRAREYARYRPQYPDGLFAWLASVAPGRRLAWDCGTGSGQAALGLVPHFDRVFATDASADQVSQAVPHERIEYSIERAEDVRLGSATVDLVTVAAAVHWFDLDAFYAVVRRVAVPGGVIAVWTYYHAFVEPDIDRVIMHYSEEILAGYWPERFRHVAEAYRNLPFPFEPVAAPEFEVGPSWTLEQLVGFLGSWSGTQRYYQQHRRDPIELVTAALSRAWGDPDRKRTVRLPLALKVGRVNERAAVTPPAPDPRTG